MRLPTLEGSLRDYEPAGTPRYVKNAAAWLANVERFGSANAPKSAAK